MAGMFGTDGVRARVNTGAMTAEAVVRLALASGRWFIDNNPEGRSGRPLVVIGKDTRVSGYMIEAALVAGFTSIGMDCRLLGPMPTPGVAYLTQSLRAHLGVMISASHNPYHDNGIKLFGPDGFKLDDAIEIGISELAAGSIELSGPEALGRASRMLDSVGRYVEFAKSTLASEVRFDGIKVVVDCANGAAYRTAPDTLRDLGAEVIAIANDPDGFNINQDCGAVHPQTLAATVLAHGADVGVALDGDADRLILVDETGTEINGDQVLACLAREMQSRGTLGGDAVVGTVMTNGGIEPFLSGLGLQIHRTAVGDRDVLERMRQVRDTGPFDLAPFGVRLTPQTAPASADAIRDRRAAWQQTEDGQAVTQLLDAVIAGNPAPEVSPPQFLNRDDRTSVSDKLDAIAPAAARR